MVRIVPIKSGMIWLLDCVERECSPVFHSQPVVSDSTMNNGTTSAPLRCFNWLFAGLAERVGCFGFSVVLKENALMCFTRNQ